MPEVTMLDFQMNMSESSNKTKANCPVIPLTGEELTLWLNLGETLRLHVKTLGKRVNF